jgi:serine/threonine-protein kinase
MSIHRIMAESFGEIVVRLGYATPEQVARCTRIQQERRAAGKPPGILGEIMVAQGYLSKPQVVEIMKQQAAGVSDSRFLGGFRVLEELGRGATGTIYRAVQISLDREVALKILSKKFAERPRQRERFLREARTVGRLRHPNIVQGIDVGCDRGVYYMAMEYIDGPTVGELLRRGGALDPRRALRIVMQIADALAYAHENGVMHRDIKPDNIMLTGDGIAKLCDLGLARLEKEEADAAHKTHTGAAIGTPHYISPEQARGLPQVDARSDIYSLGATFYHMVTGSPPFPGDSAVDVIARHISEAVRPPTQVNPLVGPSVERAILRMMAKDPAERFADAKELLARLRQIVEEEERRPAAPPAAGPAAELGPRLRRRRRSRFRRLRRR